MLAARSNAVVCDIPLGADNSVEMDELREPLLKVERRPQSDRTCTGRAPWSSPEGVANRVSADDPLASAFMRLRKRQGSRCDEPKMAVPAPVRGEDHERAGGPNRERGG
jgi:hypothetical protein